MGERLCAELHKADAGRELRPLHELRDPLDADRIAEPHRHAEDLFGELAHTLEQNRAAREHGPRAELLEHARVLDALSHEGKYLLDARLDDVREDPPCRLARRVSADAGDLHFLFVGHHATESAAEVALETLRLAHRRPETRGDVVRDVVASDRNDAGVGDSPLDVEEQVGRAAADVDDRDAYFLLVLG
jgi:hypothetical protein